MLLSLRVREVLRGELQLALNFTGTDLNRSAFLRSYGRVAQGFACSGLLELEAGQVGGAVVEGEGELLAGAGPAERVHVRVLIALDGSAGACRGGDSHIHWRPKPDLP